MENIDFGDIAQVNSASLVRLHCAKELQINREREGTTCSCVEDEESGYLFLRSKVTLEQVLPISKRKGTEYEERSDTSADSFDHGCRN